MKAGWKYGGFGHRQLVVHYFKPIITSDMYAVSLCNKKKLVEDLYDAPADRRHCTNCQRRLTRSWKWAQS